MMPVTPSRLQDAYAHCERAAADHYENFPVASLLLPREKRRHVAAIYAFARQADDFADEAAYAGQREERLADWRRQLEYAAEGRGEDPIFVALADTIRRHRLPVGLLHDLISAFEQDTRVASYESFDDLLAYCRLSANPIGRLVLHIFGRTEEPILARADSICTGLQLANFWQDVSVDLDKGRCYLPREELRRFGCSEELLLSRQAAAPFARMMRFQIARTRSLFARGADLPGRIGGRLGFELKLVLLGGLRILEMIEKAEYDVFHHRPALSGSDWGRLLVRAVLTSPADLPEAVSG